MSQNVNPNRDIERNLNAISRTPKLHREDMLRYVHRPELVKLIYPLVPDEDSPSQALEDLRQLFLNLDIEQDPYVLMIKADPTNLNSTLLRNTLRSRKTYCQQLIKSFYNKAKNIHQELGSSAAQFFIRSCIEKIVAIENVADWADFEAAEKIYLKKVFAQLNVPTAAEELADGPHLSPKVQCLINFLKDAYSADFTGLVFVQTRASVAVLCHLLSTHNSTRHHFNVSTFVGSSSNVGRKFNIGELLDVKFQKNTLDDLRHGRKNLLISTSALEEGIDVSACNNVICFEKPPNFKSFIQRRGRARRKESRFIMMFEEGDDLALMSTWQELEVEMMNTYMDDTRRIQEIQALECQEDGYREFVVKSTGYFSPTTRANTTTYKEPVQNSHWTAQSRIFTISALHYPQASMWISGQFSHTHVVRQMAKAKMLVLRSFCPTQWMPPFGKLTAVLNGSLKRSRKEMLLLRLM